MRKIAEVMCKFAEVMRKVAEVMRKVAEVMYFCVFIQSVFLRNVPDLRVF